MKSVRVIVRGEVQGVFFRDTVKEEAERTGVAGWVRNRGDGTVEARFEGDDSAVDRMIELCREGPEAATVEQLDTEDVEPEGLSGFSQR